MLTKSTIFGVFCILLTSTTWASTLTLPETNGKINNLPQLPTDASLAMSVALKCETTVNTVQNCGHQLYSINIQSSGQFKIPSIKISHSGPIAYQLTATVSFSLARPGNSTLNYSIDFYDAAKYNQFFVDDLFFILRDRLQLKVILPLGSPAFADWLNLLVGPGEWLTAQVTLLPAYFQGGTAFFSNISTEATEISQSIFLITSATQSVPVQIEFFRPDFSEVHGLMTLFKSKESFLPAEFPNELDLRVGEVDP